MSRTAGSSARGRGAGASAARFAGGESVEPADVDAAVRFDDRGLVPAVVQDAESGDVLMMAWMNRRSLRLTLEERRTWFWSRSRQELWAKGATSGHVQHVEDVRVDCDGDTLLVLVHQEGAACHTGHRSCFYRRLEG